MYYATNHVAVCVRLEIVTMTTPQLVRDVPGWLSASRMTTWQRPNSEEDRRRLLGVALCLMLHSTISRNSGSRVAFHLCLLFMHTSLLQCIYLTAHYMSRVLTNPGEKWYIFFIQIFNPYWNWIICTLCLCEWFASVCVCVCIWRKDTLPLGEYACRSCMLIVKKRQLH